MNKSGTLDLELPQPPAVVTTLGETEAQRSCCFLCEVTQLRSEEPGRCVWRIVFNVPSLVSFCILCGWWVRGPRPLVKLSFQALLQEGAGWRSPRPPPGWLPFSLPRRVGGRGRPEPGSLLLTRLLPHWSRLPSTHPRAFASAVPHARDTLPTDLVSFLGDTCCSYPGVSVFEWQQLRPAQVREAESPPGAALLCVLDLVWSPP